MIKEFTRKMRYVDNRLVRERPTSKYNIIYGMTLREIADYFGVTIPAVSYWIKTPKKKKWLEEQLKNIITKRGEKWIKES